MTAQRIVIAMHDFFRGGTERVSLTFARLWLEAGRDVTILCGASDGGLRQQVDRRVPVVVLEPPVLRTLTSRFRLGRAMGAELARLRPDLVYLPGNFHLPLARGMRQAGFGGLIVQKVSNPPLPGGVAGALIKPFYRFYAQSVDGFAAMNHGLAREVAVLAPGKAVTCCGRHSMYCRRRCRRPGRAAMSGASSGPGGWSRRRMSVWRSLAFRRSTKSIRHI